MNGINHFTKGGMLSQYAASKGVPSPKLAVYVSGLFILFGGLGILLGVYVEWAITLLAVFLVIVTYKMHSFWAVTDPDMRMADMLHFMKNLALLGAVLMFLSIPTPWALSILEFF